MVGPGNLSLDLTLMGHVSKDESPDEILSLPCSFFHIVILYNHLTWLYKRWPFCSKFQQSLCYLCSYITCDCDPAFVSVCKGDVVLKDLKLKAEALNSLRLPVTVKAGFVGTITLKVHFFYCTIHDCFWFQFCGVFSYITISSSCLLELLSCSMSGIFFIEHAGELRIFVLREKH